MGFQRSSDFVVVQNGTLTWLSMWIKFLTYKGSLGLSWNFIVYSLSHGELKIEFSEVHWGFWAAVSSKGSAFRLLRGWVFARFSSGIIYQIIQVETPQKMDKLPKEKVFKSRDPFVILPRLYKCPSDQSTVGGQPETEDGWSGPSGAKVVNIQCHNCPISVRLNISYDS